MKKSVIHAIAGTIALLVIATFWIGTLVSELFYGEGVAIAAKHAIAVYGLMPLTLAMISTGASGFSLRKERKGRLIERKEARMRFIALNGILVMIPSALFLNYKAFHGKFDQFFYAVQLLELAAGLIQLTLMSMNFRDGLRLAGWQNMK